MMAFRGAARDSGGAIHACSRSLCLPSEYERWGSSVNIAIKPWFSVNDFGAATVEINQAVSNSPHNACSERAVMRIRPVAVARDEPDSNQECTDPRQSLNYDHALQRRHSPPQGRKI